MLRAAAIAAAAACVVCTPTTINNLVPRLDNKGNIMDSHDFSLYLYPDGYFYLTSVAYGGCTEPANLGCDQTPDKCGFQVQCYVLQIHWYYDSRAPGVGLRSSTTL